MKVIVLQKANIFYVGIKLLFVFARCVELLLKIPICEICMLNNNFLNENYFANGGLKFTLAL